VDNARPVNGFVPDSKVVWFPSFNLVRKTRRAQHGDAGTMFIHRKSLQMDPGREARPHSQPSNSRRAASPIRLGLGLTS
jgi:hypothetical protein